MDNNNNIIRKQEREKRERKIVYQEREGDKVLKGGSKTMSNKKKHLDQA